MRITIFELQMKQISNTQVALRTSVRCLMAFFCLVFGTYQTQAQDGINIDKIIAKVDNYILLKSELEVGYLNYLQSGQPTTSNGKCEVLESLLINKLLLAKAEIDSVVVDDNTVENTLNARMQYFIGQFGSEEKIVEAYGKSIDAWKNELRKSVKEQLLAQEMQNKITKDIKITPKEVARFFNAIPKDSIPFIPTEVEIGQIVKIATITKEQKAKVRNELSEIRQRIVKGEDFGELAKIYSADPGSGKNGGDLGFTKRGLMVAEFEAAAMKLKPGEMSGLVESEYGFHLIQLIEKRGSEYHARHILLRPDYTDVDITGITNYLDSLRTLVLADSIKFQKAAKEYSDDKSSSQTGGLIADPNTGGTKLPLDGSMDPGLYFVLDTMAVGSVSKPIAYRTDDGKSAVRILYYKSKIPPHQANLKDDYQKIYVAAMGQKKGRLLDEWFNKTKNEVSVIIDDEFKNCNVLGVQSY